MRLNLGLEDAQLGVRLLQLLPFDLIKQLIDFIHLIVKTFLQQKQLVIAFLIHAGVQIAALDLAHEPYDHADRSGNPIDKDEVKQHRRQYAYTDNGDKPFRKGRHLLRQITP
ncbi:hypothetical protein D3C81_1774840 [compost metagenome]